MYFAESGQDPGCWYFASPDPDPTKIFYGKIFKQFMYRYVFLTH